MEKGWSVSMQKPPFRFFKHKVNFIMKINAYPTELFTSNYHVIGKGRENKIRHEAL